MISAQDPFGNAIQVQQSASVAAVAGFALGFVGYEPRILDVLAAAEHDDSLIVQACAAALWMFSEAPIGPPAARAHLQRAQAAALPSTERERQLAAAVACWVEGDMRGAIAAHESVLRHHPHDLVALKLGQYHAFNLGDSPTMLRLALHCKDAANDLREDLGSGQASLHGMLAFAWEQCHRMPEAEAAARQALALQPAEPWAQHALAHVMLTDGRLREGAAFLRDHSSGWSGLTSFMRTHNWWHLAVFELELGNASAALQLYDEQIWGVDKTYTQDQVGAVSMLARLELAGVDVGPRWHELSTWLTPRVSDQIQPFLDMQYLYGLARAGRPEADTLLAQVEQHAPRAPTASRAAWQQVAVPACRGLIAHARGHWADAAEHLVQALPRLVSIGGSHAQRDLFEQIHIDALLRSGALAGAQNLLQPRANAQPQSHRLYQQLQGLYADLGLPGLASVGH